MSLYLENTLSLNTAIRARPKLITSIDEIIRAYSAIIDEVDEHNSRELEKEESDPDYVSDEKEYEFPEAINSDGENRVIFEVGLVHLNGINHKIYLKLSANGNKTSVEEMELGAFDSVYNYLHGETDALSERQLKYLRGNSPVPLEECLVPNFHSVMVHNATGIRGVLCHGIGPHHMLNNCAARHKRKKNIWLLDLKYSGVYGYPMDMVDSMNADDLRVRERALCYFKDKAVLTID
jgi:hypothetical protein